MKRHPLSYQLLCLFCVTCLCACGQDYNSDSNDAQYANGTPQPTYTYLSQHLFNLCVGCHSGASPAAGYDFSSLSKMLSTNGIVPGNVNGSPAYLQVSSGQMPQGGPNLEATDPTLVSTLATWIQNGAPND